MFGEIINSVCRQNFIFVQVFGTVNPPDRYVCIFILLNFFTFFLSFHVCTSFWRREPSPSDAVQRRYFCNFILLIFLCYVLFFHVCTSFWRREPTHSEAMHSKLNQSQNSSKGLCMLVLRGKKHIFSIFIYHIIKNFKTQQQDLFLVYLVFSSVCWQY